MKRYIAPEADIYNYKLTGDILSTSGTYEGDEADQDTATDPFA